MLKILSSQIHHFIIDLFISFRYRGAMQTLFLKPNWPAPSYVKACTTLRTGGVSQPPFDQFNLAEHVGDNPEHVKANRELLKKNLNLPNEPVWINQTHSSIIVEALPKSAETVADASFSSSKNQICVILTADCLPILICHRSGSHVAAVHAGWRGLANGIIENTLDTLRLPNDELLVWLGPAISPANYEVGEEVRTQFVIHNPEATYAFLPSPNKRWLANLYALARIRLLKLGVTSIYGGDYCTYADPTRFYSYRRDGNKTGRMASLIWIGD
jgi:YfiH family protein